MTAPVVIDASAGVDIALRSPRGRRMLARLPVDRAEWVPELYFAEAAGALRRLTLAGKVPEARARQALTRVLSSPVRRVQVRPLVPLAWALRHNLTVADALYVVLARELHAELATTDARLAAAPGLEVQTITA